MRAWFQRTVKATACRTFARAYSTPRHLMSIGDVSPAELTQLVLRAASHKQAAKAGLFPETLKTALAGKTVAMMFNKRSTRTRVSTEAAVALFGGQSMFLGKDDIQLGVGDSWPVNESLHDTAKVISSMTACMVARVGPHSDVANLAKDSAVPVINALSDDFHPLQTVADCLTLHEAVRKAGFSSPGLGLEGCKIAWIGDSNNVLFDLATACVKLGIDISVASPRGYGLPEAMRSMILAAGSDTPVAGKLMETTLPEDAIRDADVLITDTWISMGQEAESQRRLTDFQGYQITNQLAAVGRAKPDWKFMHCLPRHQEEVADEVFYGPRSLVFQEAENRLWAAVAVLEAFVVKSGRIL